jgi:tetratricopeptide (TPR) repeat protein
VFLLGEWDRCDRLHSAALPVFREFGDWRRTADSLVRLAQTSLMRGDLARAIACAEEAARIARDGGDKRREAIAQSQLANLALGEGDYGRARQLFQLTISRLRESDNDEDVALDLGNLALSELLDGELSAAAATATEALPLLLHTGAPMPIAHALEMLAALLAARARYEAAAAVLASGEALRREHSVELQPLERELHAKTVAGVAAALGEKPPSPSSPLSAEDAVALGLAALD